MSGQSLQCPNYSSHVDNYSHKPDNVYNDQNCRCQVNKIHILMTYISLLKYVLLGFLRSKILFKRLLNVFSILKTTRTNTTQL